MKLIEFKQKVTDNPTRFSLPMFFLEVQPMSERKRKILYSRYYNGNYIIDPFYKNIHSLI